MASTILEDMLGGLWEDYFDWYSERIFEGASSPNIVGLIIAVIFIYVILMVLCTVFPFVDRILSILFIPFTIVHVWMHVREMKRIKTTHDTTKPGPHQGAHLMGSALSLRVLQKEMASARLVTDNVRTARKVAFAPMKFFLPLFALILISSPFLTLFSPDRNLSKLLHMYLLIGCLRGFPTAEDHFFIYYAVMMNATFSQWYVLYIVPLFVIITSLNIASGMDAFMAFIGGLAYSYVYFILFLLFAARYALWYDPEHPEIPYWEGMDPFEDSVDTPDADFLMLGFDE